ncbi:MAG TPA: 4-hydroxy-tetrahydrodipicolinate reductase [Clostridiales bacterium]|nr:4-hydroxy-tetrahydrodipicolinate reductase [Clostridiales bacterium]
MINILLNGCNGKMGQEISRLLKTNVNMRIAAGVDINPDKFHNDYNTYKTVKDVTEKIDVVLDFSHPDSLTGLIEYCLQNKIALIVATTGLSQSHYEALEKASKEIPVFQSANMSFGVNVTVELCKNAAKALGKDFDIEIIEKHHNEKKDAPSGTALLLAKEINSVLNDSLDFVYERHNKGARKKNEMGIYSLRGGTIPGEHIIIFAGKDEIVEIKHTAMSRRIFTEGAIKAVEFIVNKKPGYYNMKNLLKEICSYE